MSAGQATTQTTHILARLRELPAQSAMWPCMAGEADVKPCLSRI
jgi:hypothetical protein